VKRAVLALESGRIFNGFSFGADGERDGEIVFNTSMSGYQEILTDPSYCGQIVAMTSPHQGNYGANEEDMESVRPWVSGFIVRENSPIASNWRAKSSLQEFLKKHNIVAIEGIDTRALTKHIRSGGAMRAIISTVGESSKKLVEKAKSSPGLVGRDLVQEVTCKDRFPYAKNHPSAKYHVAVIDCGIKENILAELVKAGCQLTVFPAFVKAEEILAANPDGIFLSNGPGDPAAVKYVIETVEKLIAHNEKTHHRKIPIFGICLGYQMLALALGGKTFKLKFGHRGANHPVKDTTTGKIEITSQNHGFGVKPESLKDKEVEFTHFNLYDGTSEGLCHKTLPIFSVQYHPEASPGPHEAKYLFERFTHLMSQHK
jgi:carbamoyl-phosphate synthase small subunit